MPKLYDVISGIIMDHLAPLTSSLRNAEKLLVVSFTGNSGVAMSKTLGDVSIKSAVAVQPGMTVVGIPIGAKNFYVVGYL